MKYQINAANNIEMRETSQQVRTLNRTYTKLFTRYSSCFFFMCLQDRSTVSDYLILGINVLYIFTIVYIVLFDKCLKIRISPKKVEETCSEEENDDELCLYCTELYSNSKSQEGWIKCQHCGGWAHEACAGVEADDTEAFSCDFCNE
ncbi:hypothetical protein RI129_001146 [Pyrocoelia pectoralis]|uniref:Zinc finger PHD-type domain-containing protein n=1 Tax=Pyrocoelia pectoralis TaxID=417401 RepID=A0AAN7ZSD9_9COLE